jgi:Protein of unknown function (DUF2690)
MDLVPFLKSIASVTNPLTLIAFLVVALLAALLLVLKATKGLEKSQELLFKNPDNFQKIVPQVLLVLLAIAAMLFALLFHDYQTKAHLEEQRIQIEGKKAQEAAMRVNGFACYGDACEGADPKAMGCDKGVDTITQAILSAPEFGEDFRNSNLEMRHSVKCNASWVKVKAPIGSLLYMEAKNGKKAVSVTIQNDGIKGPHFTDMFSGQIERRACVQVPDKQPVCTGFIQGRN